MTRSSMKLRVASLAVEAPIQPPLLGVRAGWGTRLAFHPPSSLFFSWVEGIGSYRLGRWNLATGGLDMAPTIGLLRGALFDQARNRLHVLTEHGLHELELDTLRGLRKLRKGIPKHPSVISSTGHADLALVTGSGGSPCVLVSLSSYSAVRRMPPAGDKLAVRRGNDFILITSGAATRFSKEGLRVGRTAAPEVTGFLATAGGDILVHEPIFGEESDTHEATGTRIATLSLPPRGPAKMEPLLEIEDDVHNLLGVDPRGYLVAETETPSAWGIAWIDLTRKRVVGRTETPLGAGEMILAGSFVVGRALRAEPTAPFQFYALSSDPDPFSELARSTPPKPKATRASPPTRLGRPDVRTHVRERFDSRRDDRGRIGVASPEPLQFERCVFEQIMIDAATPTVFRNATFVRCTFVGCSVLHAGANAAFEDIVFDGCDIKGKVRFLEGLDLKRVTLRGKTRGGLILQRFPPALLARSGSDDWALDISQGEFSGLELRGLPSRLVRRNPEIHGVVRRDKLTDGRWKAMRLGVARIVLEDIFDGGQEDGLLLVNRLDRRWEERAEDLRRLRDAGIAEPR